ncbi:twin-arginine translocase TatA/TatE family subunit [Salmonella enterica]|nr:twin-arginine translocase TatA/TatE family subunit [Salmonella enterica]ECD0159042.1 twin-arginine translocase TatA/TatE family subunit [Salmonella enterica subsp. enterica]ECD4440914.1 twin-arginine translocase TatA/TatE family subunit [Salmonella enterica subsp. enterica serovar Florida]ECH9650084.1 twin-arginine translocase TatA/TatE family subunit [Salmonella enterica subsp. enterica serovar Miami]ECX3451810.1 twin-arginine translocase TatA/TatE family subunit [Salmonella enterica subsp.
MSGISTWQLAIIAVIVVLLFGTKKLGSVGADLGASVRGFKKALSGEAQMPETVFHGDTTNPARHHPEKLTDPRKEA